MDKNYVLDPEMRTISLANDFLKSVMDYCLKMYQRDYPGVN